MKDNLRLFLFAPIYGGLLVMFYDSFWLVNPHYQMFVNLPGGSYWNYFFSFITGFIVVEMSVVLSMLFRREDGKEATV